jgi:hypothetical protein
MMHMLETTHLTLIRIVRVPRIPPAARELLMELIEQHAEIIVRDNGRARGRPPSAAPVEAPDGMRIF